MPDIIRNGRWRAPSVRLIVLLYALFVTFNAFDAHATLVAVRDGAVELNPFMAYALRSGAWAFLAVKMGLACGFGLVLAAFSRRKRLAWLGFAGVTAVYGLLFLWHVAITLFGQSLVIVVPS